MAFVCFNARVHASLGLRLSYRLECFNLPKWLVNEELINYFLHHILTGDQLFFKMVVDLPQTMESGIMKL